MQAPTAADWHQLLEIASRTPSPHNVQPWRVRLRGDGNAGLLVDGGRVLPSGLRVALELGEGIAALRVRLPSYNGYFSMACAGVIRTSAK